MRIFTAAAMVSLALGCSSAVGSEKAPAKLDHPAEVALVKLQPSGWKYVKFPSSLRLYVYDKDQPGKSACNADCESRWPPLEAPADSKQIGSWTPIKRYDGRYQWAYKGRPAYTRIHDTPDMPMGDGVEGTWHFLEP